MWPCQPRMAIWGTHASNTLPRNQSRTRQVGMAGRSARNEFHTNVPIGDALLGDHAEPVIEQVAVLQVAVVRAEGDHLEEAAWEPTMERRSGQSNTTHGKTPVGTQKKKWARNQTTVGFNRNIPWLLD